MTDASSRPSQDKTESARKLKKMLQEKLNEKLEPEERKAPMFMFGRTRADDRADRDGRPTACVWARPEHRTHSLGEVRSARRS